MMFDFFLNDPIAFQGPYLLSPHFSHSSTVKAGRSVSVSPGVCDTISTCLAMVVTSISILMDITIIGNIMVIIITIIEVIIMVITHFFGAIGRRNPPCGRRVGGFQRLRSYVGVG